jgi:hypothetical protein
LRGGHGRGTERVHFIARLSLQPKWRTQPLCYDWSDELCQDLSIVDEVDGLLAELDSPAGEAWAGPIEYAFYEGEVCADGSSGGLDGERLLHHIEVCGDGAAIDAQQLANADVILSSRQWVCSCVAVKCYPGTTDQALATCQGVGWVVWFDLEDEWCTAIPCCVVVCNWHHGSSRLDYRDGARSSCVDGATRAGVLRDSDDFGDSVCAE